MRQWFIRFPNSLTPLNFRSIQGKLHCILGTPRIGFKKVVAGASKSIMFQLTRSHFVWKPWKKFGSWHHVWKSVEGYQQRLLLKYCTKTTITFPEIRGTSESDCFFSVNQKQYSYGYSTVSRKPQYKDVYRRTIEMPQRARSFQANCCLKVHNAHLKLLSSISG